MMSKANVQGCLTSKGAWEVKTKSRSQNRCRNKFKTKSRSKADVAKSISVPHQLGNTKNRQEWHIANQADTKKLREIAQRRMLHCKGVLDLSTYSRSHYGQYSLLLGKGENVSHFQIVCIVFSLEKSCTQCSTHKLSTTTVDAKNGSLERNNG